MKMNERLYLDVHVLQTVPPSCVNRDDTGSPKSAIYGGAVRARVSSQSWKRAMRNMFEDLLPHESLGKRTKHIVGMVTDEIVKLVDMENPEEAAVNVLITAGLKIKSPEKGTDALFFMSLAQAKALAKLAVDDLDVISKKPSKESKEKAQNALRENPGIDIALFGRMVADDPSLNTDACAQVAHSISTHKVNREYDYFTAVDDLSDKDNAGAGHIGTVEFNSATLYRYATLAIHELNQYLGNETLGAINAFVHSFVCSMPTGKQNTFANRTLPDAVLVTLRTDQPINLVGAFERPIQAGKHNDQGYVEASANALVKHASDIYENWLGTPEIALVTGEALKDIGNPAPLKTMLDLLSAAVQERLNTDEACL